MNFGVPALSRMSTPQTVIDVAPDLSPLASGTADDAGVRMSPFETMQETLFEIRDGINRLVEIAVEGARTEALQGRNAAIAAGDTDQAPEPGPQGNMLDSLKAALEGLGDVPRSLLGIAALLAGFAIFNALSDTLAKTLAPILEFLGETLIPNIKELNEIIMSHPGGYFTLLGAIGLIATLDEVFGIRGSLGKLFTSVSSFIRTAFIDDLDFRTKIGKSWAGRINRAIYGTKSGRGGLIPAISRFIRGIGRSIRNSFLFSSNNKALTTATSQFQTIISNGIRGAGEKPGLLARLGNFFRSVGSVIRGAFSNRIVSRAFKTIGNIVRAFGRTMARIGRFVTRTLGVITKISGLGAFLRLGLAFAKAIPIVGQIIMVVQGLFGFVTGAIKGFKKEGFLGLIIGALTGLFDGLVASFVNLIFDILGFILKKFGLEKLGQFFMDIDISLSRFFDSFVGFFKSIGKIGKALFKGTLDGIKNIFSSPIKAFKATFAEVMAEPVETSEDNAPVKIDLPQGTDNTAAIEQLEADRREIVLPDIARVDTSDLMGSVADPFPTNQSVNFAPTTLAQGDTFSQNTFQTNNTLASMHSDTTADLLATVTRK